jgi:flagellar protein FliO/FliZ
MNPTLGSLLWFVAVLAAIPLVLWLLRRTPLGARGSAPGLPQPVAVLPLSPTQRLVTIEVGRGEERLWLVLGVTPQHIATLHTMAPLADAANAGTAPGGTAAGGGAASFQQLLRRIKDGGGADHGAR